MKKLTKKILLAGLGFAAIGVTVPVVLTSCATDNGTQVTKDAKVETTFTYNTTITVDGKTESLDNLKAYVEANKEELMKLILAEMNKDSAKFANISLTYKETKDKTNEKYSIVATATPTKDHAWEDGTTDGKEVTITLNEVKFNQDATPPTETVTPEVAPNFTEVGSVMDLLTIEGDNKTPKKLGEVLTTKINADATLKEKLIQNAEKIGKENLDKLTVTVTTPEAEAWTGKTDWEPEKVADKVFYSWSSEQIDIKSGKDLHDKLSAENKLKEILTAAKYAVVDTATYTLADKKLVMDTSNDFVNVNVTETTTGAKATKDIDLQIPVSDLNLVAEATVKIDSSVENVESVADAKTNAKFDIGIEATPIIADATKTVTLDKGSDITADSVLKKLQWATDKATKDVSTEAVVIDSAKISESINVFNAEFKNFTINKVDGQTDKYTVTIDATPKSGYSFEDGTNTLKTIQLGEFTITVAA